MESLRSPPPSTSLPPSANPEDAEDKWVAPSPRQISFPSDRNLNVCYKLNLRRFKNGGLLEEAAWLSRSRTPTTERNRSWSREFKLERARAPTFSSLCPPRNPPNLSLNVQIRTLPSKASLSALSSSNSSSFFFFFAFTRLLLRLFPCFFLFLFLSASLQLLVALETPHTGIINRLISLSLFPFIKFSKMPFSTLPTLPLHLPIASLLLLLCFLSPPSSSALTPDGLSLLALKSAVTSDPTRALSSWSESDLSPCRWTGVACARGRVASLFLAGKNLSGYIPSELGLLGSLKRLNLAGNNFSKPIPSRLFNATSLVSLDLSRNALSGPIPTQIKNLRKLTHLDLSSNSLNGSLPEALAELGSLSGTLNLSCNGFSGEVPASYGHFPVMVSLDLGHNNLTGKIPQVGSLLNQGPTAFAGNPGLCGFPLSAPCPEAQEARASPGPEDPEGPKTNRFHSSLADDDGMAQKRSNSLLIPVLSGLSVVAGVVFASVWFVRRERRRFGKDKTGMEKGAVMVEEAAELDGQKGKFVVLDEGFDLELEDLLRASAYVVGKSRSGIVYKVVVGRGSCGGGSAAAVGEAVAVRRLSEDDAAWRFKEFESEVEAIGRVNHPNVVRLRAYYYASDEKLLVSDFIRNGCLHSALHGGPSKSSLPLSWALRLKIAQGTARGLAYIHENSPRKYVHGNLKSTKILLDDEFQPYISGFGLSRLTSGTPGFTASSSKKHSSSNQTILSSAMELKMPASSVAYLAPEAQVSGTKVTQKCDVYSFGIVLMEILTGQMPDVSPENDGKGLENHVRKVFREERPLSEIIDPDLLHEVHAKKQVVAAFHIALNCTELDPELRPRMRTVSESLDRMKVR